MRVRTLLAGALVAGGLATPAAQAAAPNPCAPWTVTTLASGLGSLENLEPDGKDGLFLSASDQKAVLRLTRTGPPSTFAAGVTAPGGLRLRGRDLFVNTGDALAAGARGTADGAILRIDVPTRRRSTFATGLVMPNGLAFLPDGSAVTSRDVSGLNPTGITRISNGRVQPSWTAQNDSNGLAVDPTGTWLYTDETFTPQANVYRVQIAHPANRQLVTSLQGVGVFKGLDDLTISTSGVLYVAANLAGEVIRLDPRTKQSCVIARGLRNTSAVKQGRGRAFPSTRLYAVGFDGKVVELTAPKGVVP
jgi:glucose/arabinose dehydrogenase